MADIHPIKNEPNEKVTGGLSILTDEQKKEVYSLVESSFLPVLEVADICGGSDKMESLGNVLQLVYNQCQDVFWLKLFPNQSFQEVRND